MSPFNHDTEKESKISDNTFTAIIEQVKEEPFSIDLDLLAFEFDTMVHHLSGVDDVPANLIATLAAALYHRFVETEPVVEPERKPRPMPKTDVKKYPALVSAIRKASRTNGGPPYGVTLGTTIHTLSVLADVVGGEQWQVRAVDTADLIDCDPPAVKGKRFTEGSNPAQSILSWAVKHGIVWSAVTDDGMTKPHVRVFNPTLLD